MTSHFWNDDKNRQLKRRYGVGFEDVVIALQEGRVFEVLDHPNRARYGHQELLIVEIEGYTYCVPCVSKDDERFLKTLFPSRKYHKRYRRR